MRSRVKLLLATVATAALVGCAGTNFKRSGADSLEVGTSTQAQVLEAMGPSRQTGELLRNGEKLKTIHYVYAEAGSGGKYPGVTPARGMTFFIHDDLLVGEEFLSSFAVDATEFDDAKVSSIIKGSTTKVEVLEMLGKPSGSAMFPLIKARDETALVYSYAQVKGSVFNMKVYAKTLMISFDEGGVVTNVDYTSQGEK